MVEEKNNGKWSHFLSSVWEVKKCYDVIIGSSISGPNKRYFIFLFKDSRERLGLL